MNENNELNSLNAANPLASRILYNSQMPQDMEHNFTDLERPTPVSPLLQKGDNVIKLWGYSLHGFSSKKSRYQLVELFQFTFIERNLSNFIDRMSRKYPHFQLDKAMEGELNYNGRAGVVVLPVSMLHVFEHKVPLEQLSEQNLAALAETAKQEGALLVGEVPGRYLQRGEELISKYYFHDASDEEVITQARQMIHPVQGFNPTVDIKQNHYYNKATESTVQIIDISYNIHTPCLRNRCPYCIDEELAKATDEGLRKKTLSELGGIKQELQLNFYRLLADWMHQILAELDDYSPEVLETVNEFLEAADKAVDNNSSASASSS